MNQEIKNSALDKWLPHLYQAAGIMGIVITIFFKTDARITTLEVQGIDKKEQLLQIEKRLERIEDKIDKVLEKNK